MLDRLHRHREAQAAFRDAADTHVDEELRRWAEYGAARMAARQHPPRAQGRLLIRFARRHAEDPEYASLVVSALIEAADVFREGGFHEHEERALQTLAARPNLGPERQLVERVITGRARGHSLTAHSVQVWGAPALAE